MALLLRVERTARQPRGEGINSRIGVNVFLQGNDSIRPSATVQLDTTQIFLYHSAVIFIKKLCIDSVDYV